MRERDTVKQRMLQTIGADVSDTTFRRYKPHVEHFATWTKAECGLWKASQVTDPIGLINAYSDYLQKRGLSANTIHTYLASVCKGLGVHLQDVEKPRRSAMTVTKTRDPEKGTRGRKDLERQQGNRAVVVQKVLGIRKAELYKLRGGDFTTDASGQPCVCVRKGKGGKRQYQRILPQDIETVKAIFAGISEKGKLLSPTEVRATRKIALHALRAEHARKAYSYYDGLIAADPRQRDRLRAELIDTFRTYHPDGKKPKEVARFAALMDKGSGTYRLRGENRQVFEREGLPIEYDRVALMAVSVWHLSHWRLDVTVKHYMR